MTNQHPRLAPVLAAGLALPLTAGCSVAVTAVSPAGSPAASQPPAAPSPSEEPAPAGAEAVDTLVVRSTRDADRTTATIKGDSAGTRHSSALSLWAGCEGTPDEVVFGVSGHTIFQGKLGLRTSVPDDIVIEVLILAGDDPVQNIRLDGTDPNPPLVPFRFLLDGKKTVTTQTKVVRGSCSESADSYAVLVDGYVS